MFNWKKFFVAVVCFIPLMVISGKIFAKYVESGNNSREAEFSDHFIMILAWICVAVAIAAPNREPDNPDAPIIKPLPRKAPVEAKKAKKYWIWFILFYISVAAILNGITYGIVGSLNIKVAVLPYLIISSVAIFFAVRWFRPFVPNIRMMGAVGFAISFFLIFGDWKDLWDKMLWRDIIRFVHISTMFLVCAILSWQDIRRKKEKGGKTTLSS